MECLQKAKAEIKDLDLRNFGNFRNISKMIGTGSEMIGSGNQMIGTGNEYPEDLLKSRF